ncbi:uncharacterized protein LOC121639316 [Melanotaenia boesemani]|uniref:uncharacterized protein LOC121639316 n=1 Tax=Melanotaenia boesemani TaxID=1250792 RepID=UPI001C042F35|nr:uncharacterized protein LOC121639316 [Melanotaenia boesemani]
MPRRNQKSQAQKRRWKEQKEGKGEQAGITSQSTNQVNVSVPSTERSPPAVLVSDGNTGMNGSQSNAPSVSHVSATQQINQTQPQISYADMVKRGNPRNNTPVVESSSAQQINSRHQTSSSTSPPASDGKTVMNTPQHDASKHQVNQSVPRVSYADVLKRGLDAAGPSHERRVNVEPQPSVTRVCAPRSQDSVRYGVKSRNKQCVANSLMFLSFLHEDENVTRADLQRVLDKGDGLYRQIIQRFPGNAYLATDELPEQVKARKTKYHVDLTQPSYYGNFGGVCGLQSLETGLSRLSSDIQYAVLIMGGLSIAVFRTTDGRFGFFDPHRRTKHGLPVPPGIYNIGSAIMLIFTRHQLFQSVTWSKLVQALLKLKQVHPQYQDITIRDEAELCDPTLPDADDDDDDDVSMGEDDYDEADLLEIDMIEKDALCDAENEPQSDQDMQSDTEAEHRDDAEPDELPNGGFAIESCLQPVDISDEILGYTDSIYCVAPAERNDPVSFFKTPKLEAIAFPCQFPTGQNTIDEARETYVTPSGYFKSRLFHIDERFARDPNYLFFAQFVTEIHLANSSMMMA